MVRKLSYKVFTGNNTREHYGCSDWSGFMSRSPLPIDVTILTIYTFGYGSTHALACAWATAQHMRCALVLTEAAKVRFKGEISVEVPPSGFSQKKTFQRSYQRTLYALCLPDPPPLGPLHGHDPVRFH